MQTFIKVVIYFTTVASSQPITFLFFFSSGDNVFFFGWGYLPVFSEEIHLSLLQSYHYDEDLAKWTLTSLVPPPTRGLVIPLEI